MSFPTRKADWLSFDEARARIRAAARVLPSRAVPLAEALGAALAEDLRAETALPPWDNSAMDGYAICADDLDAVDTAGSVTLEVVGESLPGFPWNGTVELGQAVRIMTGAPVPAGADTVVRVEHTRAASADRVQMTRADDRFRNIRPAGEDMQPGDLVLSAGTEIGPGAIAALASTGHASVGVGGRPRVGILTTGDELVSAEGFEAVLAGRAIVDSNGPMLAAQTRAAGGVPALLGPARDDVQALRDALAAARGLDAIVTVGGASMGTHDLVKDVLDASGFRLDFWRVRIRPGSPVSFGLLPGEGGDLPVFGLPGNPASAFVTFELFVRPFLRHLGGFADTERPRITALAGDPFRSPQGLVVFPRVQLRARGNRWIAASAGPQGSGLVRSLTSVDGLAVLPEDRTLIREGESVEVIVLGDAAALRS